MKDSKKCGMVSGGGEMGELIRTFDWSKTPLGPLEDWPQSLLTSVSIILNSQHPMWIGWGPENTFLYNDPYIQVLSLAKHPWALGRPAAEVWAEIWHICGPLSDKVFLQGEASFVNDVQLFMNRGDFLEETYYSFSYSPIRDESGQVGGLFCPSNETTDKILHARRLATLSELSLRALSEKTIEAACSAATAALALNPADFPFGLLYLIGDNSSKAYLSHSFGLQPSHQTELAPAEIDWTQPIEGGIWPLAEVAASMQSKLVNLHHIHGLRDAAFGRQIGEALVLPVSSPGHKQASGIFIAGINPGRRLDCDYHQFLQLTSGQISTAIQSAKAYQNEKRRAQELAELDRAKTTFFSNISHEFRTPLTLMLGPLEQILADQDSLSDPLREEITVVHRNSLRLLKLVNTLLDFSRIEAGRVHARFESIDLSEMTANLASIFRSTLERAGLHFEVHCSTFRNPTFIDRDMWEKIVLNLLSNAFKFTFEGRITVHLKEETNEAVLLISDTGIGIPPESLPHLFKRFHRVEGARGRTHEGSGIGLALVHELVLLHHGHVSATSAVGAGTTFCVRIPTGSEHLPLNRIQPDGYHATAADRPQTFIEESSRWLAASSEGSSLGLPSSSNPHFKKTSGARILLVDDNADMRDYLQKLLSQDWLVMSASNGAEALGLARQNPPDLVLTDVMMPVLDGLGLLRELRADPITRMIPVIMLSARAGEESRVEGMETGADDYLVKPFSAKELLAKVGAKLELARIRRESAEREVLLRREAEEAHAQTLSVLESIGDGYMSVGPDWTIQYVNAQTEKFNNAPRDALVGKNVRDLFPEMRGTALEAELVRAFREKTSIAVENYHEPFDRWFEVNAYPSKDGSLGVFFRDITERKNLLQGYELARLEIEGIFKQAPVAIAVLEGPQHIFSLANDEFTRLWNGTKNILGQTLLDVVPIAKNRGFIEIPDRVYQEGKAEPIREIELALVQADGTVRDFFLAFVFAPKRDASGQVNGIVVIVVDITAEKRAEQEKEKLLVHLKEMDRRKDEFLAVLSHELRSPLNVIGGHVELLRYEEPGTLEFMDSLEAIERNTKAQTQLISDLLDISRIVTGKFLLDVSHFEIALVLNAAVEAVKFGASSKGVRIECSLDPTVKHFAGDAMRIQQMIWNLLSNAVKFTPESGRITLSAGIKQDSIEIRVADTGQGISADFLPYVFDRFHQEDASNTRKFGGLGLGLSIVRHISELHGGTVEAFSSGKDQGATFVVRLPIRLLSPSEIFDDTSHFLTSTENKQLTLGKPLTGLGILIVDDQQDAREMVGKAFHFLGGTNNLAPSGSAALELLTIKKFDVIICDVGMPEMNGLEFIRRWRQIEQDRDLQFTPAIALTAYASDQDRQDALTAGFQSHLAKPVRISELSNAIAHIKSI